MMTRRLPCVPPSVARPPRHDGDYHADNRKSAPDDRCRERDGPDIKQDETDNAGDHHEYAYNVHPTPSTVDFVFRAPVPRA